MKKKIVPLFLLTITLTVSNYVNAQQKPSKYSISYTGNVAMSENDLSKYQYHNGGNAEIFFGNKFQIGLGFGGDLYKEGKKPFSSDTVAFAAYTGKQYELNLQTRILFKAGLFGLKAGIMEQRYDGKERYVVQKIDQATNEVVSEDPSNTETQKYQRNFVSAFYFKRLNPKGWLLYYNAINIAFQTPIKTKKEITGVTGDVYNGSNKYFSIGWETRIFTFPIIGETIGISPIGGVDFVSKAGNVYGYTKDNENGLNGKVGLAFNGIFDYNNAFFMMFEKHSNAPWSYSVGTDLISVYRLFTKK
ncbi:MAG: hypothetical protein MUF50_00415 [Planctomycetes bacterium]|jgi:hypothetical protein|nr:hypothetical protein [Planctomycetota bacterium]